MGYTELIRGLLVYEVMGSHHHTYHREPSDASLMEDYSLIFMQISVVPKEPHPVKMGCLAIYYSMSSIDKYIEILGHGVGWSR
jgi:hypothetical protein